MLDCLQCKVNHISEESTLKHISVDAFQSFVKDIRNTLINEIHSSFYAIH